MSLCPPATVVTVSVTLHVFTHHLLEARWASTAEVGCPSRLLQDERRGAERSSAAGTEKAPEWAHPPVGAPGPRDQLQGDPDSPSVPTTLFTATVSPRVCTFDSKIQPSVKWGLYFWDAGRVGGPEDHLEA